uniref:Ankyrin repeat-containing protein At3g12360 family n=1 Tax=Cajanus cajan TaxID=3821 RepID=A0A151T6S0_CAJCA|nr:Ankyrin repeat-containing protein At3g12360 family [Cajanus cajan]
MEEPQRAALKEDWRAFKKFFEQDKKALLEPMDLDKNTAIHVATHAGKPRLLAELLDMLPGKDRWRALRAKNARSCTVLHHATLFTDNVEIVDVVLKCEREVTPLLDEETDEELALVEMKNELGETPLYMAAKEGNIKMLQHMDKSVADIHLHFLRDSDKLPILHIAIIGQHLGTSLRIIYCKMNNITSRILYAYIYLHAEWDAVGRVWEKKKQHKLAEYLADMLVQKDNSWQRTCNEKQRTVVVLPIIKPANVAARKKQLNELKDTQSTNQTARTYSEFTPLLLAASAGIVEIVEKIIDIYPESINHVSENEQNVLHVAVITRQKKIYQVIKNYGALKMLAGRISDKGRTLLHQVARMEYYRGGQVAGYAYELQDELRWYERVKKIIPPNLVMHCNEDNLTAREQFEIEHASMLKEAQEWIKETAQSCSTVAVLVATVAFAAAYTVPGGTDGNGFPVFIRSPAFLFFTIMDVVALASSLASVVMFLSILTSPFEMWEFHKSLPRKLTLGFGLLFFSLTAAMLSFSATILLTVKLEYNKWSSSLIYSAAFFPVSIFRLLQFPFYMAIKDRLLMLLKKLKKMVPSRIVKSAEKSKMRKYRRFGRRGY